MMNPPTEPTTPRFHARQPSGIRPGRWREPPHLAPVAPTQVVETKVTEAQVVESKPVETVKVEAPARADSGPDSNPG